MNCKLEEYATCLGSDCAFFIRNEPMFATGRGEVLETLSLSLEGYKWVLVKPQRGVSTPEAYAGITPKAASFDLRKLLVLPVEEWGGVVRNDFEDSVRVKIPEIQAIKNTLEQSGASYTSMTGSGSAIYALFKKELEVKIDFPGCYVWQE